MVVAPEMTAHVQRLLEQRKGACRVACFPPKYAEITQRMREAQIPPPHLPAGTQRLCQDWQRLVMLAAPEINAPHRVENFEAHVRLRRKFLTHTCRARLQHAVGRGR